MTDDHVLRWAEHYLRQMQRRVKDRLAYRLRGRSQCCPVCGPAYEAVPTLDDEGETWTCWLGCERKCQIEELPMRGKAREL